MHDEWRNLLLVSGYCLKEAVQAESHGVCGALCPVKYARTTLFNKHTIKTIIHYDPSCQTAGFINVLDVLWPLSPTEQREQRDVVGYSHEIMK